ncbi:MAG TPA: ribbon-helix-helix domain-containing protein [Sandaracinaceae bacterium]
MNARITIGWPEDLAAVLARDAKRRGETVSALVREALEAYPFGTENEPRSLPFVAAGRSGKGRTARHAEAILAREWSRDRGR